MKILAIDLSLRHTGYAFINREKTQVGTAIHVVSKGVINTSCKRKITTVDKVYKEASNVSKIVAFLNNLARDADLIVIEVPHGSRSHSSSMAMGACYAIVSDIMDRNPFTDMEIITGSELKKWSGSKKGDGKKEVDLKVRSRMGTIVNEIKDDNIIDALGIALLTSDKLSQNEAKKTK